MKNKSSILIVLLIFLPALFVSCELDEDDDPLADIRDKFIGTWRLNESEAKSSMAFYDILINIDPGNTSQVLIRNFANTGSNRTVYGIVTTNQITVPAQTIASLDVSGLGVLTSNNRMNWTYSVNDGADLINYTALAEKQ
ncbi:MAG TPA: hypothetical protein ENN08_05860 [Bacteroidales bacterium]|mgnify:CR=1 FL=1|nr:hypothetical protein [Bacteroidales bacterium]